MTATVADVSPPALSQPSDASTPPERGGPAGGRRPPVAPVPLDARALAPDVARGAMLLLIALANVHLYLYGRPVGARSYPAELTAVERVVTAVTLTLVDGRAYPMFGALFGYGIGQLAARRLAAGAGTREVIRTVRRRGWWLVAIGAAHAALLWSGDIVAAYGVLAVALAGVLVAGTVTGLATTVVVGVAVATYLGAFSGFSGGGTAALGSMAAPDPSSAAVARLTEWGEAVLIGSVLSVLGAVALGAWAARHRVLDEPGRHRRVLVRTATGGLAVAVLGGLPLALVGAEVWAPEPGTLMLVGALHTVAGYAGGVGYAAVFGLLALRSETGRSETGRCETGRNGAGRPGPVLRALAACGQRSLSCYLGQSVLFVLLLPAWTLGLGGRLRVDQAELLAVAVWLALLLVAVASAGVGYRGPAEVLLRRLTYGRPAGRPLPPN